MRNPKWHRDEIILALELYFAKDRGSIDATNPKVIELSGLLNKLPIFEQRPDAIKFRNPNGVSLKLSNFLAIDPAHLGKGMQSYSKLDYEIFNEFAGQREKLHAIATEIKKIVADKELVEKLYAVEEEEPSSTSSVSEGQVIYKLHKVRERDRKIVAEKKKQVLKETGCLACEICSFDFHKFYGEYGKGFIECHHLTPLGELDSETTTTLADLALVCSNCHRMIHKVIDKMSVADLKKHIKNR